MKKFFIFTRGRTGSTAIRDELNSRPDTLCHGEIFRLDPMKRPAYRIPFEERGQEFIQSLIDSGKLLPCAVWKVLDDGSDKTFDGYVRYMEGHAENMAMAALGFKLLHNQAAENEGLLEVLLRREYKILHLIRRNVVRQVLSGMLAKKRGLYNTRKDDFSTEAHHVDLTEFKARVENNLAQVSMYGKRIREMGFDVTDIYYEDYVEDRDKFHEKLADCIGLQRMSVAQTDYKIMVPEDLRISITNYEEFVEQVDSMGFRAFI